MDESFVTATADEVRGLIASLILQTGPAQRQLGSIMLASHQIEAVARLSDAIAEFGGAFLCDVVGSGKTYTALAIARKMTNPVIVAPAGLREMWKAAMHEAGVDGTFVTAESLSRRVPTLDPAGGIIVDEAHYFRSRCSARHINLCKLIGHRPVLLVTATPIHNSRADLEALASIFLGSRARMLSAEELARLVVRRATSQVTASSPIPRVTPTKWLSISDDRTVVEQLLALPAPVPFRDAGEIAVLFAHGLIRQWASSEAALRAAVSRRLRRAASLEISLQAGEYPSASELRSWMVGDDAIQLGFPGLLPVKHAAECAALLGTVRKHASALRVFSAHLAGHQSLDDQRADRVRDIVNACRGSLIVAFATYEATVETLFKRLAPTERIAVCTSRGGRVAGGPITRREIVRQLSPEPGPIKESDRLELLLTTDLLSEGVNLQRASVAVHLDLPWTSARMDQRVGRIARIGSSHTKVTVYGVCPPASAERVLRGSSLVRRKSEAARRSVGTQQDHGMGGADAPRVEAPPELHETTRQLLSGWTVEAPRSQPERTVIAAAQSNIKGFLAVVQENGSSFLIASCRGAASVELQGIGRIVSASSGVNAAVERSRVADAGTKIDAWMIASKSRETAGLGADSFLRARRRALNGIDALAADARPNVRIARAALIESARRVATSRLGAADEAAIHELAKREVGFASQEWLERMKEIGMRAPMANAAGDYRIRAILLLVTPPPSS